MASRVKRRNQMITPAIATHPDSSSITQNGSVSHGRPTVRNCHSSPLNHTRQERIRRFIPRTPSKSVAWPLPLYTLTRICSVEYIKRVESVFEIIAEPDRRAILSLLVSSHQSVGEIERQLRMTQPTVSKHLRVLREAGFVESTVDAQRRLYRLKPEPFQEVNAWLDRFRRFWSDHVDALERHLDRMDQSAPAKTKTKKRPRGTNRERDKGEKK